MTIWYTADLHFGHDNIIKHCNRPFESASHMDAMLLANLSARVGPQDTLWIVGDFAFGPRAKDRKWLANLFARLPGKERHLVVGNHDGEATQSLPWTSVSHTAEVADGNGAPAVLNHYPMITWHRARKGALHLFGHVHDQWMGSRNAVNIGVDVWGYVPVTLRDIAQRARTLPENKHWQDVERGMEL
ncbi:metallophosphoesterase [Jannaschia pohangensis]|uniref:Calcineurin-like phosphoesterase superfamily protein n=1 Tax=Jannaschia pohangensis TaxID=390807 RepID=A0A1I3UUC5_9RHOB|nr:metallophosphoesterase [Jannaschia pohangensis]SFJ86788.1 Calcineurin-like phosphoesterase superfamily protein [Jannaschia pohangensis]